MIRKYLQKDADIKNKSPEEQKRIIQAYVKKVIVYENTIDINKIVDLTGGADGSRTHDLFHAKEARSHCATAPCIVLNFQASNQATDR
jgi:hypothetical protein